MIATDPSVSASAARASRASGKILKVSVADAPASKRRLLIAIPRKLGGAVRRNRVRRQIREIVRLGNERIRPEARLLISVLQLDRDYGELELEVWELLGRTGALR